MLRSDKEAQAKESARRIKAASRASTPFPIARFTTGLIFIGAVAVGVNSAHGQNASNPPAAAPGVAVAPAPVAPPTDDTSLKLIRGSSGYTENTPSSQAIAPAAVPAAMPAPPMPASVSAEPSTPPPVPNAAVVQDANVNKSSSPGSGNKNGKSKKKSGSNSKSASGSDPATAGSGAAPAPFVPSVVETVRPPVVDRRPTVVLHTSMGEITLRLYRNEAPRTVQNFIDLVKGDREFLDAKTSKKVRRPFYTGLIFHRVVKNFVIQTGCPFGTGRGGPGYTLPDEISPTLKHDRPGVVSMALAQDSKLGAYSKNSNGSQFFITLAPEPSFDGKFTVFGEVIKGMDVAKKISAAPTGPTDRPIKKVYLLAVDIDEPAPEMINAANGAVVNVPMPASLPSMPAAVSSGNSGAPVAAPTK